MSCQRLWNLSYLHRLLIGQCGWGWPEHWAVIGQSSSLQCWAGLFQMTDTGSSLTMTATTSSSSSPAAGKVLRRTDSSSASHQQQQQQQPQQQEDSCGVGCFSVPGRHSSQVQVGLICSSLKCFLVTKMQARSIFWWLAIAATEYYSWTNKFK